MPLTQSIFLEIFGDPASNPKGLKLGRIGNLLDDVQYGTGEKAGDQGALPILRMGNITVEGRITIDDLKYIDLPQKEVGKFTVRKGDILFNRTNSADLVGKTAVFEDDRPFAFAGYLIRARSKHGVSPRYISGYLNSLHGKRRSGVMAKSIVGMANINAKEMQAIPILVASAAVSQDTTRWSARLKPSGVNKYQTWPRSIGSSPRSNIAPSRADLKEVRRENSACHMVT